MPVFAIRRPRPWRTLLRFCALACLPLAGIALAGEIRYPREEGGNPYPFELLELALSKAGNTDKVVQTPFRMMQDRALLEIGLEGGAVDIMATMTSTEREARLLPIRIPITKGLIGWRIPVVTAERRRLFGKVSNLTALKGFQAVQGHDWPDLKILRHNGLRVHSVSSYDSLFNTLSSGRVDYLPLSLLEAHHALKGRKGLVIDQHVVLHYPAAIYYFVNPRNTALAETVRRGLEACIADGSFDRLFYRHFGEAIAQARLSERTVIELDNPYLPASAPLERKGLWFRPDEATRRQQDRLH
jgi:hypothetical protein